MEECTGTVSLDNPAKLSWGNCVRVRVYIAFQFNQSAGMKELHSKVIIVS